MMEMTTKKAVQTLKTMNKEKLTPSEKLAIKKVILLASNHIPKKPIREIETHEYCCGECGMPLYIDGYYCVSCGTEIDWEGRE